MFNNYWDWSFPYFTSQLVNYFGGSLKTCWDSFNLGQPSSYSSGYYLDFVLSRLAILKFLKSEYILGLILLILLILIIFASKKLVERKDRFIFILLLIFNPAIYYKLLAGHLNYYSSYLIFIYLIYYLLRKYRPNLISAVCLGLILAFVGFQIQFYVMAFITLVIYFICNRDKFSLKYFSLSYLIVFLVNLPWLSNFLVGANKIQNISGHADSESFTGSMFASPLRIVAMTFSSATNIQYVYSRTWLIFFGVLTIGAVITSVYYFFVIRKKTDVVNKEENQRIVFLMVSWAVFSALATGYFQKIPAPLIRSFYPMFREVGHFAPIVVLFEVLTFAFIFPYLPLKKILRVIIFILLGAFLSANVYYFVRYLPKVNYESARVNFQPFENFIGLDTFSYRVMTYPFWNQYSLTDQSSVYKNGKLLSNSGWDSFIGYSGQEYLSNYAYGGASINDTLQYALLKNYDITPLEQRNIKYIYDFSKFYESNFEKYASPADYDSDLSLIKNDPEFQDKLIAANPGKITKLSDNILILNDSYPRIYGENVTFKKVNNVEYKIEIKNLKSSTDLAFLDGFNQKWKLYLDQNTSFDCQNSKQENGATECLSSNKLLTGDELKNFNRKSFADETHSTLLGYANKWTIDKTEAISAGQDYYKQNNDGSINLILTLYFQPQSAFLVSVLVSVTALFISLVYIVCALKSNQKRLWQKEK
jgi:hypothetical protein